MTTEESSMLTESFHAAPILSGILHRNSASSILKGMDDVLAAVHEGTDWSGAMMRLIEAVKANEVTDGTNVLQALIFHVARPFALVLSKALPKAPGQTVVPSFSSLVVQKGEPLFAPGPSHVDVKKEVENELATEDMGETSDNFRLPSEEEDEDDDDYATPPPQPAKKNAARKKPGPKPKAAPAQTTRSGRVVKKPRQEGEKEEEHEDKEKDEGEEDDAEEYEAPEDAPSTSVINCEKCFFCDYRFSDPSNIKTIYKHLSKFHALIAGTFFECNKCGMKMSRVRKHGTDCDGTIRMQHDAESESCPLCDVVFSDPITHKSIQNHMSKRHNDAPGSFFSCDECDARFRTVGVPRHTEQCGGRVTFVYDPLPIKRQAKRSVALPDGQDHCPFCDEKLGSKRGDGVSVSALNAHITAAHKELTGTFFRCSICTHFSRRSLSEIRNHLRKEQCDGRPEYFYDANGGGRSLARAEREALSTY